MIDRLPVAAICVLMIHPVPSARQDRRDRGVNAYVSKAPQFIDLILAGNKSAEIRRHRPASYLGTLVIIYATKPTGAIVGTARISTAPEGTPDGMREEHHGSVDITREEFDYYLTGAETAYILILESIQRLESLLTLEQIRAETSFQPPQSYRYVTSATPGSLTKGHPDSDSLLTMLLR